MQTFREIRPAQSGSPGGVHEGWAPLSRTLRSESGGRAHSRPLRVRQVHRQGMVRRSQQTIFCSSTPSGLDGRQQGSGRGGGQGLGGFSPQAWQVQGF